MFLVCLLLVATAAAQSQPQCLCSAVAPCKASAEEGIVGCADKCQSHVTKMGASYPAMRSCLTKYMDLFRRIKQCEEGQLANTCAQTPGRSVPKRFAETLKIAAYTEINAMLSRSGLQAEGKSFMSVGKKFAACVMKCMERGTGSCVKKLGCGLDLPSDNELVQQTKRCAISSGFTTPVAQEMCRCVAAAGVQNLAPLCGRLQIS